jgi:hypothetical protein
MFKKVSDEELIKRMTWLSKRFPDFKTKFYTYYHYSVKEELKKLNVPFEEYHGINYDSYAEDICDVGIFLNIDKKEILDFTKDIENEKMFWAHYGIHNERDMIQIIFEEGPPKSLVIENVKEFVKEITDEIWPNHEQIVFYETTITKRRYEELVKDDNDETIKAYHDVTETKTKKIKIQ